MEPTGPHHLQKSRNPILRTPNRTPSTPWLHQEILSINIFARFLTRRITVGLRGSSSDTEWWSRTFLNPSESPSMPRSLPHQPPQPHTAWPASTRLLPHWSHRPKRPDRTSIFCLTASLTDNVHQRVWVLPPRQALITLRPQHRLAFSTIEAQNMAYSDSMYAASSGTWLKLSEAWLLELLMTGDSAGRGQQIHTISLGLLHLTAIIPHHQSQLTTR